MAKRLVQLGAVPVEARYWVTALRFPYVDLPKAAVIDEAYVLFPVRTAVSSSFA